MPTLITTGTVINLGTPAIELFAGDTVTIEAGAFALSNGISAAAFLTGNGNYTVDVQGTLSGYGTNTTGLIFNGTGTHTVAVGQSGSIFGRDGGILVNASSQLANLENFGLISTNDASGTLRSAVDIQSAGNVDIFNAGKISSTASNAISFNVNATGTHSIENFGIILATVPGAFVIKADDITASVEDIGNVGTIGGIISLGAGADRLENLGFIDGAIFMGSGIDVVLNQDGSIDGVIDLGDDADQYTGSNRQEGNIDRVNGGLGNDTINGNAGNDVLDGGGDADTINGGTGNDQMTGGTGNDTFFVDSQSDTTIETAGQGVLDTVRSSVTYQLAAAANIEVLETTNANGTAALNLTGNSILQTIIGNAGANVLHGGIDSLADILDGRGGNDTYALGALVNDTIVDSAGTDTIISSITRTLVDYATVENLLLTGANVINGTGNGLNNTLTGNAAANVLNGGTGNDFLIGAGGNDTLIGGIGNDQFVFNSAPNAATNRDSIADFNVVADTIRLENTGAGLFNALANGVLSAAAFKANAIGMATDADDRIIYNTVTGALFYDTNGNVAGGSVQFATLTSAVKPVLTAADFLVI